MRFVIKSVAPAALATVFFFNSAYACANPPTHLLSFRSLKDYPESECKQDTAGRRTCIPACAIDATFTRLGMYQRSDEISVDLVFANPAGQANDKSIKRWFQFKLASKKSDGRVLVEGLRCDQLQLKKLTAECILEIGIGRCLSYVKIKVEGYSKELNRKGNFVIPE